MKKSFNWLIFFLFMTACNTPQKIDLLESISEIQQNNISDKRLDYWDINIKITDGKTALQGITASKKAFKELQNLAKSESLEFDVDVLPVSDFKENQWAVVTLSVCNIRSEARHSAELATQALMGTPVKVFTKVDDWYLIQTPDRYFGWVDNAGIALKTNAELAEWKALEKVIYKKQNGFAYTEANAKSLVECDLVVADLLSVVGSEKDFYKIVMGDGRQGFVPKEECESLERWKAKDVSLEHLLATAFYFKGVPYLWGGTSAKMVDCSGFTKTTYYLNGIILQRDASQQTLYGELVDTEKNYEKLQAGDLVFFGKKASADIKERVTHVGLCMGKQEFIHASGKVRINSLDKGSAKYTAHYENGFIRARRIVGNIDGEGIEWIIDNDFYKEILPQ